MVSYVRIFISISKNAVFTNINLALDKKHCPKVVVKNTTGTFCATVLVCFKNYCHFIKN